VATQRTVQSEVMPPHRFLREVFRHYLEYREYVANGGDHVLEHSKMGMYTRRQSPSPSGIYTVDLKNWLRVSERPSSTT
jgi:hypothetical protein